MRIEGRGQVDRSKPVAFEFDGKKLSGFDGDTLASALLANDVRLVGRSFKYHRPRGIWSAGSEEPNALMQIGAGAAMTPNVRATMQEVYPGLVAQSQNRWPSLDFDALAVNDFLAPFLGAGFYYKTFMWPRSFWERVYEPMIRRAAGLGKLPRAHDDTRRERGFAYCDVLVIGAGPAGLMAALTAAEAGAEVILADEDARMGGRLLSEVETVGGKPGVSWIDEVLARLAATGRVRLMPRTTVTGVYDGGTYGALERVGQHLADPDPDLPQECFWRIAARRAILATGAIERPIAFPMNDRPGVMGAAAVRSYLNRFGVSPGHRIAVFCNNDSAHRTAHDLREAGVEVSALIDTRREATTELDVPLFAGAEVADTKGRLGLTELTVRHPGGEERIEADCLAVSGGWNPTVHLACHLGGRPQWNAGIAAFVPCDGMVPGLIPAGACAGEFSTSACLHAGAVAGLRALRELKMRAPKADIPVAEDTPYRLTPIYAVEGRKGARGRAWLDFQNDVTVKDVRQAARENMGSVEHTKRYTTQGMAADQGKTSNVTSLAVLADATGRSIRETGTTTFRPPFVPVSIGALGAGGRGKGFAPERKTTSQEATEAMGAEWLEAGLWFRPGYFPKAGDTGWRDACDREVGHVRDAVGVCDISTLGKIDLQGPDAGEFLDLVYANTFSTLKPGRVRYGLMLREDGHVMDDGTTACLAPGHYLMTTTTAAAGQVMRHLEFVHQCLVPTMRVRFISVTEQWAQFAIAGPKSRDLLDTLLDDPVPDAVFPFMSCGTVTGRGVAARLFRISFSGECGYEIAVPARYGAAMFEELSNQAEALGGGVYGMEALNVLRIEKGFITHAEIHGRVTAGDIGMGRMVSAKKDCIGKTASKRPGLTGVLREQLVGLRPVSGGDLLAGAHLFPKDSDPIRPNSHGYITSACVSPTLGMPLALGFLRNGHARHGEVVTMVDHLREVTTDCEVCEPVFLDPEGGRARG